MDCVKFKMLCISYRNDTLHVNIELHLHVQFLINHCIYIRNRVRHIVIVEWILYFYPLSGLLCYLLITGVQVIQVDMFDPASSKATLKEVYGVFLVITVFFETLTPEREVQQVSVSSRLPPLGRQ